MGGCKAEGPPITRSPYDAGTIQGLTRRLPEGGKPERQRIPCRGDHGLAGDDDTQNTTHKTNTVKNINKTTIQQTKPIH